MKLFVLMLSLIFSAACYSADYYVSYSSGNDTTGNGSQESPWKTTAKIKAVTTFTSTDRIYFKRGDVWQSEIDNDNYTYYIGNQPGKEYATTLAAYGTGANPSLPKIGFYGTQSGYRISNCRFNYVGANSTKHACTMWDVGNINTEFDNCEFIQNGFGDTVLVYKTNNVLFKNCYIVGGSEAALTLNTTNNCTVQDCYLSGDVNGILCYQNSSNNIIKNNFCFSNNHFSGAPIELGWGNPQNNQVYNNKLYSNNYGLFVSGTNNLIYNNLINSLSFVLVVSANTNNNTPTCSNNKIYNNTFATGKRIYVGHNVDPDNECIGNEIINNIFNINDDVTVQFTTDSASGSVIWLNNCFYTNSYPVKVFVDGTIINTLPSWEQSNVNIRYNILTNPNMDSYGFPASSFFNNSGFDLGKYYDTDILSNKRYFWFLGCYNNKKMVILD